MDTKKISHLTSAHPRYDTRIFVKECRSLARSSNIVSLVVADGKGDECIDNVKILDVGAASSRLNRIFYLTKLVYLKALALDSDIYHLHDPELIPVGLKLKKKGKKVVFDAHEDLPKQILAKHYLSKSSGLLSRLAELYERWSCRKLDGIITATSTIQEKFLQINLNTVDIKNYPMLGELAPGDMEWATKPRNICYIGGLTEIRGILEIVQAVSESTTKARLLLCGSYSDCSLEEKLKRVENQGHVEHLGFLDRDGVRNVLHSSIAGLVTLHPTQNYVEALPVKMFEYMSAGIPVIASNFPLWREIVEKNDCGLCVDPLSPKDITKAIDYLVTHPEEAERMGRNGRAAVKAFYNWEGEEKKLREFYRTI